MKQILECAVGFRRSLRFRLIVASLLVELVMLAVLIGNNLRQIDQDLSALNQSRITELSETFSVAMAPILAARDYASLRSLAERMANLSDILYVAVQDADGHPLISAGKVPRDLTALPLGVAADGTVQHAATTIELYGQDFGRVRFGLSLQALLQAKKTLLTQGSAIAAAELVLSVAALWSVTLLITRDLDTLTRASVRFAAGDYLTSVRIKGRDEVAALSAAFNSMSMAVREQFARLEKNAEALRRSNSELARLAEITAHHLQEPLRRLVSYSQLLEKRSGPHLPPESKDYLHYIVNDASRMKRLLVDLQTYEAISPNCTHRPAPVDLTDCANEAFERLHQEFKNCGAHIAIAPLPQVTGDADALVQVFLHLFDNALTHRQADTPPMVEVKARQADGAHIVMVRDNGPGIPQPYRERVFQLFERLDAASAGTGVGLAVVKKIVESHGGRAWIASVAPHGTEVNLMFPAGPAETGKGEGRP